jgi:hypothetical protein
LSPIDEPPNLFLTGSNSLKASFCRFIFVVRYWFGDLFFTLVSAKFIQKKSHLWYE